jgi:ABC-type transport system involved in multi-copper enzyme maturation permease subunit
MLSILRIEWLKIKKYPAFWWMLGIVALTYPGINYIFYKVYEGFTSNKDMSGAMVHSILGNPFAFPETWHSVAYFSSFFIIVPSILVIMIITNEYTYKTNRQNIIDGWSRNEFITGKILDVAIIALVATLTFFLTATFFGLKVKETEGASWTEGLQFIPLFLLQTFSQLSIAFLLGFLIKNIYILLLNIREYNWWNIFLIKTTY